MFPSRIACLSQVDPRRIWNGPAAKRTDVTDESESIFAMQANKRSPINNFSAEDLSSYLVKERQIPVEVANIFLGSVSP
ncbi:unnamed protein product [Trichogramma brassicae]|uniref:Uncharacterized protein n=1 Tax=Trichogramma brassicae TaxID=86971 RepID=A0A6H5IXL9_9HYME|nr:unnamed protein product [Trichogramma brassicae]